MSVTMPLPTPASHPASSGCRLVAADGRELALRAVHLDADCGAGLARTVVHQTFANPFSEPLQVTYQLPLPADGAVVDFAFTIGDRRIQGRVARKADARESFERAVVEGRTAALLEQDRSSLFRQELGNVPPGAELRCEVAVEHPLAWRDGGWEWRFPTVVAPRFLGTPGQTRDAHRIGADVLDGEVPARCGLTLALRDARTGPPTSPSHVLEPSAAGWGLAAGAALDRDVVVRWPVAALEVGTSLEVARAEGSDAAHALLTVVPPRPEAEPEPVPRDLILLLDVSGSMGGRPIEQLKAFCRALVRGLGPRDQLEMIAFASQPVRWRPQPATADPRACAAALAWIEKLTASGGTHMHDAIREALRPLRDASQRQVVLVSDGLIGFEQEVIGAILRDLPARSRVHTVGVGSGVNRSLTGPCARAGAGVEVIVGLDEPVEPAVALLLSRTERPLVVGLEVGGSAARSVVPARLPDLFAGAPARLALELDPRGGTLVLRGRTAAGPWSTTLEVPPAAPGTGRRVVGTRFARERVEDLELRVAAGEPAGPHDAAIEALGLAHRIATRLTSWVAETEEATVDPGAPTRAVTVPQSLPYGTSAEGLGLRVAGVFGAPMTAMAPPPPAPAARMRAAPAPALEAAPQRKQASLLGRALDALGAIAERAAQGAPGVVEQDEEVSFTTAGYAAAPATAPERAEPALAPLLVARVRLNAGGRLVLDLVLPVDVDWGDGADLITVLLVTADGRQVEAAVLPGTTRGGRHPAGTTARLVVAWSGPAPVAGSGPGFRLEVR